MATRRIWIVSVACSIAVCFLCLQAWEIYRIRALEGEIIDVQWNRASDQMEKGDSITPNVGVIQFIKGNSFSITLDKVAYTQSGLYLKGTIGNATNLNLSNLTLTFAATKQIYEMRGDFDKADKQTRATFYWLGSPEIGSAQSTTIATLIGGGTQNFEVTIPNVRQTPNGVRITVVFSGNVTPISFSYLSPIYWPLRLRTFILWPAPPAFGFLPSALSR